MHTANWSIYYIWYLIGLCQGQKTLCLTLVSKNSLIHSSLGHIFNDEYTRPPSQKAEVLRQSDGCVFWGLVCRGLAFTHTGWKGYCSIYSALARVRGRVAPARHTHTHAHTRTLVHTLSLLQKALDIIKKQSWQLPPPCAKTQHQQCICHNNLGNNTYAHTCNFPSLKWQAWFAAWTRASQETRIVAIFYESRISWARRQRVCWLINSLVPSASVHSHCRGLQCFSRRDFWTRIGLRFLSLRLFSPLLPFPFPFQKQYARSCWLSLLYFTNDSVWKWLHHILALC